MPLMEHILDQVLPPTGAPHLQHCAHCLSSKIKREQCKERSSGGNLLDPRSRRRVALQPHSSAVGIGHHLPSTCGRKTNVGMTRLTEQIPCAVGCQFSGDA